MLPLIYTSGTVCLSAITLPYRTLESDQLRLASKRTLTHPCINKRLDTGLHALMRTDTHSLTNTCGKLQLLAR
jgi:hypothetical protein